VNRTILLDTGPLVAVVNEREHSHPWAVEQASQLPVPYLTCEPVLTEACFLLRKLPRALQKIFELLERRQIVIPFRIDEESATISRLLDKYSNVPISLADACLVRMSEQHPQGTVWTLDSDFKIYRKSNRQVIPLVFPERR
jgi:uncharacterized protein